MPINDNGNIIRAVGFVAIYGAYLEDKIAELVEVCVNFVELKKSVQKFSASEQIKHLLKSLKIVFRNVTDYSTKQRDVNLILTVLASIEDCLKDRHHVIHSTLISNSGKVRRRNRRLNTEEEVSSQEVIDLANKLFKLQSKVGGLRFPLQRLRNHLLTTRT